MAEDKVVVYQDDAGEFRWHKVATNGQITAESGEGFRDYNYAIKSAHKHNQGVAVVDSFGNQLNAPD